MITESVITIKNLSKKYELTRERPVILKDLLGLRRSKYIYALKGVTLNVKQGEVVGIVGNNGSGKSTLLKVISGITAPTRGSVNTMGRVGSLIELGAGFVYDMSGYENILVNGSLIGYTKAELDNKISEIISFSELSKYIHQPLRTYSTGMIMRLAFSIVVYLDPDIMLIDEAISVGDEHFQSKALNKLKDFTRTKTLIIVSHNLTLLQNLTDRVIYLSSGEIKYDGRSDLAITKYMQTINITSKRTVGGKKTISNLLTKIELEQPKKGILRIKTGGNLNVKIYVNNTKYDNSIYYKLKILNHVGQLCSSKTLNHDKLIKNTTGKSSVIQLSINKLRLLNGIYNVYICSYYKSAIKDIKFIELISQGFCIYGGNELGIYDMGNVKHKLINNGS